MRVRSTGKIIVGALIMLFALLAIIYTFQADTMEDLDRGVQALCFALLSLTSATCYRYFED